MDEELYGMIPFVAPELLSGNPRYSQKADIYNLGILLWVISSGRLPFNDLNYNITLLLAIINGKREQKILDTPPDYHGLCNACWNGNPEERPNIKEVYHKLKRIIEGTRDNSFNLIYDFAIY